MPLQHSQLIEAKWTFKKGRGVFARQKIRRGSVIERVPVVILPALDVFGASRWSKLAEYVFKWDNGVFAIALGYGSLYNHSYHPNAEFRREGRLIQVFYAIRNIEAGEEITVDYNGPDRDFKVLD